MSIRPQNYLKDLRVRPTNPSNSFVVYTASAIYIIGLPDVMREFQVGEQEALLGLSLYVFACKSHTLARRNVY